MSYSSNMLFLQQAQKSKFGCRNFIFSFFIISSSDSDLEINSKFFLVFFYNPRQFIYIISLKTNVVKSATHAIIIIIHFSKILLDFNKRNPISCATIMIKLMKELYFLITTNWVKINIRISPY